MFLARTVGRLAIASRSTGPAQTTCSNNLTSMDVQSRETLDDGRAEAVECIGVLCELFYLINEGEAGSYVVAYTLVHHHTTNDQASVWVVLRIHYVKSYIIQKKSGKIKILQVRMPGTWTALCSK